MRCQVDVDRAPIFSSQNMKQPNRDTLNNFRTANINAGCNEFVVDVCMVYYRYCLDQKINPDFGNIQPKDEIWTDTTLSQNQKRILNNLWAQICLVPSLPGTFNSLLLWYSYHLLKQNIPVVFTTKDLAKCIGISHQELHFLTSNAFPCYISFEIPKKGKGTRKIDAPVPKLKMVQRWIYDHILKSIKIHECATAYAEGKSILINAAPHVNSNIVLNLDIKSFFPSISFTRVLGLYLSFGYIYPIAEILAKLSCYKGVLPQGAPTSPAIANLVCRNLDNRLSALSELFGYHYTRYADDMTFSGDGVPDDLVREVKKIVKDEGFEISKSKTRIFRRNTSQRVTGLVVNRKINISKEYYRKMRSIIHNIRIGKKEPHHKVFTKHILNGHACYIYSINKHHGERILREIELINWD